MNPTQFWYKLVDMTQSNTAIFSVAGVSVTEKYLIWIIGLSALVVLILLGRSAVLWVMGGTPQPMSETEPTKAPVPAPEKVATPLTTTPPQAASGQETPQSLLADTSDRKRSLNDFVTPDTIHTDVMKQTLNNDFPYQTLKPNPTMISSSAQTGLPVTPTVTPVAPTVVVPPAASPQTQSASPLFSTPAPVLPPLPTTPLAPQVFPQKPLNPQVVAPAIATPTIPTPVSTPAVTPVPQVVKQQQPTSAANPQPSSVLPPLPPKEPTARMVVGVADNADTPITTHFNPTDPIIP